MRIDTKPGAKVVYTGKGGPPCEIQHANKYLVVDKEYTVDCIEVGIGPWVPWEVYLKEIPAIWFSTIQFRNIEDEKSEAEYIDRVKPDLEQLITDKISRVEVIGNGREYVNMNTGKVQVSLQDDGRTLKIFVEKGKN